ncbi:MAG: hypothetical protein JNM18_04870, partial [Planctomycetaceae bacterium]|nr:hypothetical protein [Planctomycetaceae bacterium]
MRQPKLCFHKSTGRYFVRLNGQQVYLGQQKREARAAYDRLIGEWLVRGRKPLIGDLGLTVCEMLERYRHYAESYYVLPNGEPSSELNWIASSCRVLRKRYGEQPAASIGPMALESLREAFITAGYCRTSVNARIDRIRRVFRWAVAKQLVPPSVYEALRALPGLRKGRSQAKESEPVGPVADTVVDATLPSLPAVVADMVRLQRLTGARPNEICSMKVGEVNRTDSVWQYRPGHHKTEHHGRARVILIGPKAQAILAPYLLNLADAFVF